MVLDHTVSLAIVLPGLFALLFAGWQFMQVAKVKLEGQDSLMENLLLDSKSKHGPGSRLIEIYNAIRMGADAFLRAEYRICCIFVVVFGGIVFVLTSSMTDKKVDGSWEHKWDFTAGALTAVAFVVGALTSMVSGYLGMKVAVFANARTSVSAMSSSPWTNAFNCAFRAGSVMGFSLCGLALLMLYAICAIYNVQYNYNDTDGDGLKRIFECVAGFGLGGSSIAMFGRVGGGIYTKAADVGADLAGKVVAGIPEDDPRNPATIADNVGDNVGDVAGMGSDLFGSFAEASCAALVVIANACVFPNKDDSHNYGSSPSWRALMFPLMISSVGIVVCFLCSFLATAIWPVKEEKDVERVLKVQLLSTTVLITAALLPVAYWAFDGEFRVIRAGSKRYLTNPDGSPNGFEDHRISGNPFEVCMCVWAGLWAGCMIGFITEYFTSHSYKPTQEVAHSCETGAATNIIYGLALGYKSAIIPVCLLAIVVYFSFSILDMLGVALAALGMLANLATCLSIDVYGPVCDNAGGIAEMAELPKEVRDITDALDAAGNTTAAIGKGFAIGSACLVGLALFGAFITRSELEIYQVSLLEPIIFAFLLVGAMIPYWFSALTMKSVGMAAHEMVMEVKRQFDTIEGLLEGREGVVPDHERCIEISTRASLREMIAPGILVMASPILTGVLFGTPAVAGLLAGAISSSIQMAISASNTGGAWDNAKKYVEKGEVSIYVVRDGRSEEEGEWVVQGKGTDIHKAAVVGDTVGDPLKDTSGPALNIVMKLMAILSLVFADFFKSIQHGQGVIHWNK